MSDFIVLGTLQGATEFLPISSSGHLYLAQYFYGFEPDLDLVIFLHLGSLLAVVCYFARLIFKLVTDFFSAKKEAKISRNFSLKILWATVLTIPGAVLIEPFFENFLSVKTVGITLFITGFLIFFAEFLPKKSRKFSWGIATILGLVQSLTVIPGISRSGTTITALLSLGIERQKATEISFLLSIPTIFGAMVFALKNTKTLEKFWSIEFLTAGGMAFVTSLLAIIWMMRWGQKQWLFFGFYCVVLGTGLFLCY
jgi:undecaprenyl-diphosphatase